MQAVWSAGADVIAIDATQRPRPDQQDLAELSVAALNYGHP